jgi:hypothetical protein
MNKKIDFFIKDNKSYTINNNNNKLKMAKKPVYNSKTSKNQKLKPDNVPKRRGRRPKKILENISVDSDNSMDDSNQKNDSAVICKIPFDPSKHKLRNMDNKKTPIKKISSELILDDYVDNESSEGMFKNDIPDDNTCQNCSKNEKIIGLLKSRLEKYENKEKIDKSNKIYSNNLNFISYSGSKKVIIKKTDIWCWWDGHPFTNLPCVLPELYHNNTYHVTGCFCSFNCALAYNLYYIKDSKIYHRKSLVYKLYREMYKLSSDDDVSIVEAPPRERLINFGGKMSIEAFRRSLITINKEYIIYMPPIKPINITIEERNVSAGNEDNGEEFVLKRKKPLTKKRSIITSMKIKMDDSNEDDDE